MKAYVLTVVVIDHDEIGQKEVVSALENARYPNRCISPNVKCVQTYDIGEWHDDHPLNKLDTDVLGWLVTKVEK